MKRFVRNSCLFLLVLGVAQVAFPQQGKKKKVNFSFNFGSHLNDTLQISAVNIGFLTNIYRLNGVGINAISSIVSERASGIQISGISNITGKNLTGVQIAGITNVNGESSCGAVLSGLVNITGRNASGITLSGGINVVGSHSNGFSFAGLLNTVAGETNGLQVGGIANITGEKTNGVALSGLLNVTASDLRGVQISSLLNVTGDQAVGMQFSGLGNVGVKVKGVQFSGLGNVAAEEIKGLQFSPLFNFAKKVNGAQIGLLNYSMGEIKGLQLGLINYSKDTSTVKIGLVNLNPRTRTQLLIFAGNTTKINLGVRFLNRITYTMLGGGAQYLGLDESFSLTAFYRAGLHFSLFKQLTLSGDLGYAHIESFRNKRRLDLPARMYSLQARLNLEYYPVKRFGVFATGGFAHTRLYCDNQSFENKPIIEAGIILFR